MMLLILHLFCIFKYSTALMQLRTRTTLFLDSTGLFERSTFAILKKIARVANGTRSRLFCDYQLLDRLRLTMANRVAMEATLPFYQTVQLRYYVYLITVIPLVHLFLANIVAQLSQTLV